MQRDADLGQLLEHLKFITERRCLWLIKATWIERLALCHDFFRTFAKSNDTPVPEVRSSDALVV